MSRRARRVATKVLFRGVVLLLLFWTLFPFYWTVVSSLKPRHELFTTPVRYWPSTLNWQNYITVFTARPFGRNLFNSAMVSLFTVGVSLMIGALASYALGRIPFRGRQAVLYAVLAMTMFPQIAILGALFLLVRALGLYNTWWGLVLTYLTFTLPFTVWVLTSFFRAMPRELEEAAFVDGATPLQTLRWVLVPLAAPAMVTTGLLAFIQAWNEFLFALTFTVNDQARTVPVAIAYFSGATQYEIPWGEIMAASVIVTLPLILLVLIFQRRIVEGLTAGAVKG